MMLMTVVVEHKGGHTLVCQQTVLYSTLILFRVELMMKSAFRSAENDTS